MRDNGNKRTYVTCGAFPMFGGFITWLGGAVFVANQPGMNFWDGLIWTYYIGRFIAQHAAALTHG